MKVTFASLNDALSLVPKQRQLATAAQARMLAVRAWLLCAAHGQHLVHVFCGHTVHTHPGHMCQPLRGALCAAHMCQQP